MKLVIFILSLLVYSNVSLGQKIDFDSLTYLFRGDTRIWADTHAKDLKDPDKVEKLIITKQSTLNRIDRFQNLKFVTIWGNHLTIPNNISRCKNLEVLILNGIGTNMESITDGIPDLKFFICEYVLESLPNFLYKSPNLSALNIFLKDDKGISDSILRLNNLEYAAISFTSKIRLPCLLFSLPNIYGLNIVLGEGLDSLYDCSSINSDSHLEYLSINTDLDTYFDFILKFKKLHHLSVSKYSSMDINKLRQLSHLQTIYIDQFYNKDTEFLKKALPDTKFILWMYDDNPNIKKVPHMPK